jgi:hypothetical protein
MGGRGERVARKILPLRPHATRTNGKNKSVALGDAHAQTSNIFQLQTHDMAWEVFAKIIHMLMKNGLTKRPAGD